MKNDNSGSGSGISFLGALQIVFIILKLCHVIEWSWALVLVPAWIWLAVIALVVAVDMFSKK